MCQGSAAYKVWRLEFALCNGGRLGHRSDVYGAINFARQYGMAKENVAERILVIRAFTVPQVWRLLSKELPAIIHKYQINCANIPGLLNTIDEEPSMRAKEAKKQIGKIIKMVNEISSRILVITSIQEGKYTKWVLPEFQKRINLLGTAKNVGSPPNFTTRGRGRLSP